MANLLSGWDKIRRWIDNEPEETAVQNVEKIPENKSESELFMLKLLHEVEAVLRNEIVRVPNTNKAYAPEKFVVYLSDNTDKNLRRDKREFLEQGLSAMIFESAKEMVGDLDLTVQSMKVEIAVDPMLIEDIEVKAVARNEFETVKTTEQLPDLPNEPPANSLLESVETVHDFGTVEDVGAQLGILYRVEIWQGNQRLNEYPIIQKKNTIGRDDGQKAANLRLPTDNRKISRFHAEIELNEQNEIWVTSLHRNPTIVSGQVIRNGERARLGDDGEIMVYDFTLKIKF